MSRSKMNLLNKNAEPDFRDLLTEEQKKSALIGKKQIREGNVKQHHVVMNDLRNKSIKK